MSLAGPLDAGRSSWGCFAEPRTGSHGTKPTETICFPHQNDHVKVLLGKSGAFCTATFGRGSSFPAPNARQGGNSFFTSLKSPIISATLGLEKLVFL